MTALKEIMNLIYVGFSDRQFFVPQDLKFSSVIFLTIFTSISYEYVCISFFLLQTLFELHTIFNAICKTCKSLIPPTFFSACVFPFLVFPPTKNKKTRLASNFVVTLYSSLSINQMGVGYVCWRILESYRNFA